MAGEHNQCDFNTNGGVWTLASEVNENPGYNIGAADVNNDIAILKVMKSSRSDPDLSHSSFPRTLFSQKRSSQLVFHQGNTSPLPPLLLPSSYPPPPLILFLFSPLPPLLLPSSSPPPPNFSYPHLYHLFITASSPTPHIILTSSSPPPHLHLNSSLPPPHLLISSLSTSHHIPTSSYFSHFLFTFSSPTS